MKTDKKYTVSWLRRWELISHLAHTQNMKKIAEIGVYYADTATRVIGPDNWEGKPYLRFEEYLLVDIIIRKEALELEKEFPFVKCWQITSAEAAKKIDDNYFELVFIDANHSYESVKEDILAWYPKVKKNGWLIIHDYFMDGIQIPQGPKQACDEIFGNDFILMHEDGPYGNRCCVMKRKG